MWQLPIAGIDWLKNEYTVKREFVNKRKLLKER